MQIRILFFIFFLVYFSIARASIATDPWQFEVAPYLWALNMDGDVDVGREKLHVDQSFEDILKELDLGAMLWLDAHKGPLGFFLNSLYAELSDTEKVDGIKVTADNKFGLFTAGVSYIAWQHQFANQQKLQLEPYAGARYTFTDTTLKIKTFDLSVSDNQHWYDPLIGLRVKYDFATQWLLLMAADVGGVNTSTHYSYNANAFLGYTPFKNTTAYLGYRFLHQRYQTGHGQNYFNWNMNLFGPVLGVGFRF